VCGSGSRSEPAAIKHDPVQEICGREGRRVFVFAPDEDQDVNLTGLNSRLRDLGYEPSVEARLGTTFSKGPVKGSVLKSGVAILEGVDGVDEAKLLHESLLRDL